MVGFARKHHLPNYNVFDEPRVFRAGPIAGPFRLGPLRVGTPICEDSWYPDVAEAMAESGAEILMVPNGSPFRRGKFDVRMNHMVARVVETGLPLVYLNMVGGQDDQVFDGGSFVLNPGGGLAVQLPVFEEVIAHVDFERGAAGLAGRGRRAGGAPGAGRAGLPGDGGGARATTSRSPGSPRWCSGSRAGSTARWSRRSRWTRSGPENVRCVMLPSEFTSRGRAWRTRRRWRGALGCRLDTLSIEPGRAALLARWRRSSPGAHEDVTEENLQSRLRGVMLMALSNKFGEMLLTTGNKSEVAVGYATIYGDMAGGYNPIKDLYKTRVFETCRWRNDNHRPWMKGPGRAR